MSIPKEPRQQMINMMYLVLTALLAMNVSKEVLEAFGLVNEGLTNSNVAIDSKTQSMYAAFQKQLKDNKDATPLFELAQEAQGIANEMNTYIEGLKDQIITASKGYKIEGDPSSGLKNMSDIYSATNLMVGEDRGDGEGVVMQKKINEARNKFLDIIDKADDIVKSPIRMRETFDQTLTLNAKDPDPKRPGMIAPSWESKNFNQVPVIAAQTILTKFQNDVSASEGAIVEYLLKQIGATDFKVDKLSAKVIAPSSYLQSGKEYSADIFIAASNSSQKYDIFLGSLDRDKIKTDSTGEGFLVFNGEEDDIPLAAGYTQMDESLIVGGEGKYKTTASGVGEKTYSGVIRVKQPKGGFDFYPFESTYEVAPPSGFSVAATKMNVFYIGVDNPVSITVSGAKDSDISASISNGTIKSEGRGKFNVRVSSQGEANINVSALIDEDRKSFGPAEFRAKRIPDPVPTLGGKLKGGKIQRGTLKAQSGVVPMLENFDFEARFNVVSFELVYSAKGEIFREKGSGPRLTPGMKTLISNAKPKDLVIIDNIKVRGPDGQTRKLTSLAFELI